MRGKKIISILILLCFLIIPVSAVGDDNPYNAIWFSEGKTYSEKMELFKEAIGFNYYSSINNVISMLIAFGESYYDKERDNVLAGTISFDDLSLPSKFAVYNYITYGKYDITDEQIDFRDNIDELYQKWVVPEEDIIHDIENNCIPTLNELPSAITYDLSISLPQER